MRFRCFFDKSSVSPLGDFSLIITPKLPNSSTISAFGGKIPLTYINIVPVSAASNI